MSLIIATGSNIGDSLIILKQARDQLASRFGLIAESRVYVSKAIEYENQPNFFNQVLELNIPASKTPQAVMLELLQMESDLGRNRTIPKGPRTLDLDIIFWDLENINEGALRIPHPRWSERSFVIKPLQELPFFQTVEKCFTIPRTFKIDAFPITSF